MITNLTTTKYQNISKTKNNKLANRLESMKLKRKGEEQLSLKSLNQ